MCVYVCDRVFVCVCVCVRARDQVSISLGLRTLVRVLLSLDLAWCRRASRENWLTSCSLALLAKPDLVSPGGRTEHITLTLTLN